MEGADPLSDPEERRVLYAALDSFRRYRHAAHYNITHLRRQSFYSLPLAHVDRLSSPPFSLPATFDAVDDAIDANADLSEAILQSALTSFGIDPNDDEWKGKATVNDMDKARSTIRQFYRDWSAEGHLERRACYAPILSALDKYSTASDALGREDYAVLVPGAGLGRLVLEICAKGFIVEGNEISYHQLMASNYVLNCTRAAGQHKLFPWALNFSNHSSRAHQLQSVAVPDVHPPSELEIRSQNMGVRTHFSQRMSMSAGDFCSVYRSVESKDTFDAIVTCFFIDTAPNFINYVETIQNCLKPGGIWINHGPLLWHFESAPTPAEREHDRERAKAAEFTGDADPSTTSSAETAGKMRDGIGEPGSFELTNEEVIALVKLYGFELVQHDEQSLRTAGYISDPNAMLQTMYRLAFWVARKA